MGLIKEVRRAAHVREKKTEGEFGTGGGGDKDRRRKTSQMLVGGRARTGNWSSKENMP